MKEKLKIDVVSDISCPWCFVGKKHMEEAISKLPDYEVEVNWHPFQLDPSIPDEGQDAIEHFSNKFGSFEKFKELSKRVVAAGDKAGISFAFQKIEKIPNTLKMHQLLNIAGKEGIGPEVKEAHFKAYFEQGKDLTNDITLCEIMAGFGWATSKTMAIIYDKNIANAVNIEIGYYKRLGVNGVPFFIVNDKYTLSGAQPPHVFVDALKSIGEKLQLQEK